MRENWQSDVWRLRRLPCFQHVKRECKVDFRGCIQINSV